MWKRVFPLASSFRLKTIEWLFSAHIMRPWLFFIVRMPGGNDYLHNKSSAYRVVRDHIIHLLLRILFYLEVLFSSQNVKIIIKYFRWCEMYSAPAVVDGEGGEKKSEEWADEKNKLTYRYCVRPPTVFCRGGGMVATRGGSDFECIKTVTMTVAASGAGSSLRRGG